MGGMDALGAAGKVSTHASTPVLPTSTVAAIGMAGMSLGKPSRELHPLQNKFTFWFMRRGGSAGKPSQPVRG